jgi:predicted RecB family nuclease
VDTKLARSTKASALLQICSYVDQLARIQGREPEWMHVALGGSARTVEAHRVADYMAYYRVARRRFETGSPTAVPAYPPARRTRARRILRRLPLGRGVHGPPAQGRRPLAGGGIASRQRKA